MWFVRKKKKTCNGEFLDIIDSAQKICGLFLSKDLSFSHALKSKYS